MSPEQLRDQIVLRLDLGWTLGEVETMLIEPARLSEDDRDALWLFAWSYPGTEYAADQVRTAISQ